MPTKFGNASPAVLALTFVVVVVTLVDFVVVVVTALAPVTVKVMVFFFARAVPATGLWAVTFVHVVVPAPDPSVRK
jgi:hypothetical protein